MTESIGAILKEARRRRALRVKDVAAKTKARISTSYLSCIENDLRLPSEELLLEIAELLGLDQRQLYLQLVRAKAPPSVRDEFLSPPTAEDPSYAAVKGLPVSELVERAAEGVEARRELQVLRRSVARLERARKASGEHAFLERWEQDAGRYRMAIEKTVIEANISVEGDLTLHRHVIGLEPREGHAPIVAIQHTVTRITDLAGESADDGFKLLEHPADVLVEVEREPVAANRLVFRLLFPDGLGFKKGKVQRVSYSFRSVLAGAYTIDRERSAEIQDTLSDDQGSRAILVIHNDKPVKELEIDVRFPRYYVPAMVTAWAGTQEFYEADENFIDQGVCVSWALRAADDYRVSLAIKRPQLGMKFGIAWKPLFRDEYAEAKRRLEIDQDT